jgi:5-formyltetrahydrofolate cyclo-ligase
VTVDKSTLRERVWDDLADSGVARFPFPPHGRIPNFAGAAAAADRLADTGVWADAAAVKANPDAPQLPVRRAALRAGKRVYMAVPRLRDDRPFYELDPAEIPPDEYDRAPTVSHVESYARQVAPADLPAVDLVVSGSVAVTEAGARVGKGEGYSDLEWAVLAAFDRVGPETTVATTVHERQVVDGAVATAAHDVPMDLVATPERLIRTGSTTARPAGVDWAVLGDRVAEIPVLDRLREGR